MPNSRMGGSEWHRVKGLLGLVLLGLLGSCGGSKTSSSGADQKIDALTQKVDAIDQKLHVTDSLVQMIHKYLGNNQGADPKAWTGLTGSLQKDAIQLRKNLDELTCDVAKLKGDKCGDGGTVPSNPPPYPP